MRHPEQLRPFIRRQGLLDAHLSASPQSYSEKLEKELLYVIRL
jgi:hypothetical protein